MKSDRDVFIFNLEPGQVVRYRGLQVEQPGFGCLEGSDGSEDLADRADFKEGLRCDCLSGF